MDPKSRNNNSPKPLKAAEKAVILQIFGVQVGFRVGFRIPRLLILLGAFKVRVGIQA